ncbi:Translin [Aspergillus sclerotioniger CBS 115572]|uniref:Translin n=1 Tax=Aspergillus sclerotioniger CBS 115572 TaxID=1450535 RepID=A0A317VYR1_9EURO|nr:Translin [Aspergillus sclerotioniger CBS 115572]PWY78058.1 Translin [Aspergillus sclerotioniger CBS 115572]
MAGTKRTWDGQSLHDEPTNATIETRPPTQDQPTMATQATEDQPQPTNPIISMFETFRDELDEHHDRRERLIKTSRDITALSKKISGIQEFIEALSFHHYLTTQTLITLPEVRAHLPPQILVTEEDYLLGLFDLTGEMMRFAVTALSAGSADAGAGGEEAVGLGEEQRGIVVDLRDMRSGFEGLSVPRRHVMLKDMGKKVDVMQGSVEKVERAAYGILVRGRERPKGWRPDLVVAGGGGGEEGY